MRAGRTIALGIDIGGTAVKLGLLSPAGDILARDVFAFDRALPFEPFVDQLAARAESLRGREGGALCGMGIATPGHAEPSSGILVDGTANVPCLKGRPLVAALRDRLGCPALIVNDGLAAATAELHLGIGRSVSRFVVVAIGTGIGGGVVLDGRVQAGPDGAPPEIGALVLHPSGERNDSGLPGTFEHLACAGALVRRARERWAGDDVTAPDTAETVFTLAAGGNDACAAAIDDTARWIAQALGGMINLLNLEACVIGGGVASAGEALLAPVRHHLPAFTWPYLLARTRVTGATHGADAGWIGAARLAIQHGSMQAEGAPGLR